MELTPQAIKTITKYIYERFPDIAGSKPRVQQRPVSKSKSALPEGTYLVTFQKTAHSLQGTAIPRSVRVIVNQKGEILRVSTSR
jgi:hypothetical protein